MAASSEEEGEEYEYEEIEVEEEVEVEEEEEEEEFEEVEEEVEEEEEEEPEEEEPMEEEEEEPMEEEEDEEAVAETAAEVVAEAEEEYEEVEEEVEVTDDEDEEGGGDEGGGGGGGNGDEEMEEAAAAVAEEEEEGVNKSAVGSSDSPVLVADHPTNDVRQDGQFKGGEVCSRSKLQDVVKSEVAAPLDICAVEAIGPVLGRLSPDQRNWKGKEVISVDDGRSSFPESLKSVADPPKLGGDTVEEGKQGLFEISPLAASVRDEQGHVNQTSPAATSERLVLHNIKSSDTDETTFRSQKADLHLPSTVNMDQNSLRYYTPQMRPRSSSPGAECEAVNKRAAMVCEYFAKGWCIKGSSCRFLHKRDQVDYVRGQVDRDMLSTKSEIGLGKGSRDAAGASKSLAQDQPSHFMTNNEDMFQNSTGGRYTEKDHRECLNNKDDFSVLERGFSYSRRSVSSQRSPSSRDGLKVVSTNETEVDMFRENHSTHHLDHHGSSASLGCSTSLDNFAHDGRLSSRGVRVTSCPQNSCPPSPVMLEESVAMRREYTLVLHSGPAFGFSVNSGSSLRNTSLVDDSSLKELLMSYKKKWKKGKFDDFNWEPSVPFRPSHFITSYKTSSSDVQYHPLRDSIEQPYIGHTSFRHSSYGQTGSAYQRGQSVSSRSSLESLKRLCSDGYDKDYYSHDKGGRVVEAESAAISATDPENKNTISDEENPVVAGSVKEVLKATRSTSDCNSKLEIDESRQKGEIWRPNKELDEEESKVIKIFRAALVEFVKELLKPVWHEGRLSKDVYKVIVQRAEDKILSTLPSNEVPNTTESIKQYLSSSRPKILKLIQAYVDKYGKF